MAVIENLSGQLLGQYQVRDLLGRGGMSAVYHAYQPALERHVAIKILSRSLLHEPTYLQRFMQEAKTIAALEHPHIVPIYDYGTQNDISYIVMRLLSGGTLAQRLDYRMKRGGSLPSWGEVSTLMRQLASALDYAHGHGVIHRDIKTGNVMFDRQGAAYLVDFGIAKLIYSNAALTTDGSLLGTPSYMAPELWRNLPLTPAVDQYALAVLAYLLITGRMPYSGSTYIELMREHVATPFPPIPKIARTEINQVLSRALAKSPEQRFPNVGAFAEAFAQAIQGLEGEKTDFSIFVLTPASTIPQSQEIEVGQVITTPPFSASIPSDRSRSAVKNLRQKENYLMLVVIGMLCGLAILIGLVVFAYLFLDIFPRDTVAHPTVTLSGMVELPTLSSVLTPTFSIPTPTVAVTLGRVTPSIDQADLLDMTQLGVLSMGLTPIRTVAISPDSVLVAAGGGDGFVRLWDVATQSQQAAFAAGGDVIYSVTFSPNGSLLAAGGGDGFIRLWDVETGKQIRTLANGEGEIRSVAFDLNGQRLASGGLDRTIHIWDITTGTELANLQGHSDRVLSVAFSPDGSKLASASQDRTIMFWDIDKQTTIMTLNGHTEEVRDLAFSSDGTTIASSSIDDTVKVWNVSSGQLIMTLEGQEQDIFSVVYSSDDQFILVGDRANAIRILDSQTGREEAVLLGHEGWVFDLHFSQDGSILASSSGDGSIRLWGN